MKSNFWKFLPSIYYANDKHTVYLVYSTEISFKKPNQNKKPHSLKMPENPGYKIFWFLQTKFTLWKEKLAQWNTSPLNHTPVFQSQHCHRNIGLTGSKSYTAQLLYLYHQDNKGTQNNIVPKELPPVSTDDWERYPWFHAVLQNSCFPVHFRALPKGRPQESTQVKTFWAASCQES